MLISASDFVSETWRFHIRRRQYDIILTPIRYSGSISLTMMASCCSYFDGCLADIDASFTGDALISLISAEVRHSGFAEHTALMIGYNFSLFIVFRFLFSRLKARANFFDYWHFFAWYVMRWLFRRALSRDGPSFISLFDNHFLAAPAQKVSKISLWISFGNDFREKIAISSPVSYRAASEAGLLLGPSFRCIAWDLRR